ncbi:MAG: choice-of-anchor L domain-containing protein, partial [Chitinophagaceae bacterium]|nr:choice-of-anchor L domain-containing protein [Chitinophagaceae bacterium]
MKINLSFRVKFCCFLCVVMWSFAARAQMTVTPNQTAAQLVDRLVGTGVVYTNPTLTCGFNGSGKFDLATTTTLTMDSGIVLTCGNAIGVNTAAFNFASTSTNTTGGDADLQNAATGQIYDLCKLEFDFVPIGDTIKFNYRFGSEEYTSYTCSSFNDIFSFFISGPGYAVPTNLALIPGTNCPVSINTINGSTSNPCGTVTAPCAPPNNALFINNSFGTTIIYDGMTAKLLAKAAVTPCSTYHMKFAIADVFDHVLDSGVFLEANSFFSEAATIDTVTSSNTLPSGNPFAVEGCNASVVTLSRPYPKPFAQNINLVYAGTATNGVDCNLLPNSVTIPANATTTTFTITPVLDALAEGSENLKIYVYGTLCSSTITDSIIVSILDYPNYNVSNNDTICLGQSTTMTAIPTPANAYMTFSWTPAGSTTPTTGTTVTATPAVTTTYHVLASFPGCPVRDSLITIYVEPTPTLTLTPTDVLCYGNNTGSILATGAVTYNPLSMTLQPGGSIQNASPATFSNLTAATYTVTVTSSAGCTKTSTTTITQPSQLNWNNLSVTNIPCGAGNVGQISATAIGGNPTINYSLMPGGSSNSSGTFPGLATGTYTMTATDANSCSITGTASITQPIGPTINLPSIGNLTCVNSNNGTIQITANGSGTVTYTLMPGALINTTGSFGGLAAGTYTITVVDATACTSTTSLTIMDPAPINLVASAVDPLCNGSNGTLTFSASGGTGALFYTVNGVVQSSPTPAGNGTYTIIATDANNCTASSVVSITVPTVLNLSASATDPLCNGGTGILTFSASGGTGVINYTVNGVAQTSPLNLISGTYTVAATDANNCTASSVLTLTDPAVLNLTASASDPLCFGSNGSLIFNASGGTGPIVYTVNGAAQSSPYAAGTGTYTIIASDANNCTASSVLSITIPAALNLVANGMDPLCGGSDGVINFSATGGTGVITYTVNGLSQTSPYVAPSGSYTIVASDANNCTASTVVLISIPTNLNLIANGTDPLCGGNNGTINFNATGGTGLINYTVNGIAQTSPYLAGAGSYTIVATDANNCTASSVVNISIPTALSWTTATATDVLCNAGADGTITTTATSGTGVISYTLQAGNITNATGSYSGLSAGTYTVTATDQNNCSITTTLVINEPTALQITNVT